MPFMKNTQGSENFPPHAPHARGSKNKSHLRFISFASFFQNPPRLPMNPPERVCSGREGRLGRVFLYSAQKKLGGRLWSKAGPASRIPHLGLCKLNCPHEPGGGPEQEVDLNKKKKVVNTSIYPDEVIERLARCFYPAILECFNSEEGQRAFAAWQAEQARPIAKEKQDVPTGERPALHTDYKRLFSDKARLSGCAFLLSSGSSRHCLPRPAFWYSFGQGTAP